MFGIDFLWWAFKVFRKRSQDKPTLKIWREVEKLSAGSRSGREASY
jgi:hypothetical protein